jgi:hypothetical protein
MLSASFFGCLALEDCNSVVAKALWHLPEGAVAVSGIEVDMVPMVSMFLVRRGCAPPKEFDYRRK